MGEYLRIYDNDALTNLDGLGALASVGGGLSSILQNAALTSLNGLSGITSVSGTLEIYGNYVLPDCEACDLLDQITSGPTTLNVGNNLDDTCTPVPENCPP